MRSGTRWIQRESVPAPRLTVDSDSADAGVFEEFWKQGLLAYGQMEGIDWSWISMDGTMTKAVLAGSKNGSESDRPGETGG